MIEIVGWVGAIALIVVVLFLRAVLAMPFARTSARFVPAGPAAGLGPLFEAAARDLETLGFSGPRWVLASRADGEPVTLPLRAVFQNADGGLAWLGPPANARAPHRLFVHFNDRLRDGRLAISQPFDPYFEATQTDEIVARTAAEPGLVAQWGAHRRWVAGLGSEPVVADDAEILDQAGGLMERQRKALLARGELRALSDTVAVPRLGLGLRMVWRLLRMPKPPPDPRPVPAERLALLARVQDVIRHRAPPRRAQWLLFAASVVLFMGLGALLWDARFAVVILVVVLIHELGHFLAMRAFGYRNVHILALPLVGGVAMGVDATPGATRSAWMSLMGPLPGIVIGWVLLGLVLTGNAPEWSHDWIWPFTIAFLVDNYLNVLPIPPLDGAHVVEKLLPLRHARLQTAFLGIAAAVGIWFAISYGYYLLAALAAFQLVALPANWRTRKAEAELATDTTLPKQPQARMLGVLRHLERRLGPPRNATARINEAFQTLTRLDTVPMGVVSRVITGSVYLGLLVVPVTALFLFAGPLGGLAGPGEDRYAAIERERIATLESARALPLSELLASSSTEPLPVPADEHALAAADSKLGRPLPDEIRALYRIANGVPALDIQPVEAIETAAARLDRDVAPHFDNLLIDLGGDADSWAEIPLADARHWWHLGGLDEAPLFYLPDPDARLPGIRVVSYDFESPSAYASLREWLDQTWGARQQYEAEEAARGAREAQVRAALRDAPVSSLAESWSPPDLWMRWMIEESAWPTGADDATIAAAQTRLGVALPADLVELLRLHDGFPPVHLLPASNLARWHKRRAQVREGFAESHFNIETREYAVPAQGGVPIESLAEDDVQDCIVVTAFDRPEAARALWPRLLWCPTHTSGVWIDLSAHRRYESFRLWLFEQAAPALAMRQHLDG